MEYPVPWNENIAEVTVRPIRAGRGMYTVDFFSRHNDRAQNFRVSVVFVRQVALYGRLYTRADYVHDCGTDEILGVYRNETGEEQSFYPMQAENFLRDLRIVSSPEKDLTDAERQERARLSRPV